MSIDVIPDPDIPAPPPRPTTVHAWIEAYNNHWTDKGHQLVVLPQQFTAIEHELDRHHDLVWVKVEGGAPGGRNQWPHYLLCDCWAQKDDDWCLPAVRDYGWDCPYLVGQCRQQLGLLSRELHRSEAASFGLAVGGKPGLDRTLVLAVMCEIGTDRFVGNPLGGQVTIADLKILLDTGDESYVNSIVANLSEQGLGSV